MVTSLLPPHNPKMIHKSSSVPTLATAHPMQDYQRIKKLGSGSFGSVYLVKCLSDSQLYVQKEIDVSTMTAKAKREAMKEVGFLAQMNGSSYIIHLKQHFEGPPYAQQQANPAAGQWASRANNMYHPSPRNNHQVQSKTYLYIIMEYADGGDLDQRLKQQHGKLLSEQSILHYLTQIVLGLHSIHSQHVLHRDMKCENMFLQKEGNLIKIGDFGISKGLQNTLAQAQTRIGTPYYLSPEICMNQPYSYKTDIWSLGVILYELMTLQHPFDGSSMENLLKNIVRANYNPPSKTYSTELRKLLDSLLQKSPNSRPTIHQILKSPLLQPYIQQYAPTFNDSSNSIKQQAVTNENQHHAGSKKNSKKLSDVNTPAVMSQQPSVKALPPSRQPQPRLHQLQQQQTPKSASDQGAKQQRTPLHVLNANQQQPRHPQLSQMQAQLAAEKQKLLQMQQQHQQPTHRPVAGIAQQPPLQQREAQKLQEMQRIMPSDPSNYQLSPLSHNSQHQAPSSQYASPASYNQRPSRQQQATPPTNAANLRVRRDAERNALEDELAAIRARYFQEKQDRQNRMRAAYNPITHHNAIEAAYSVTPVMNGIQSVQQRRPPHFIGA